MKATPSHIVYSAVLLLLPIAGCASHKAEPPVSQPQSVAAEPATPQPDTKPQESAAPTPATAAAPAPSGATAAPTPAAPAPAPSGATAAPTPAAAPPPAPSGATAAPKATSKTAPPVARTPAPSARAPKPAAAAVAAPPPAASLDLSALKEKLKATKAIGVFTKISLKNQVDDLMKQFSDYYQGKAKTTMAELRRSYDLLLMKVLSLLQDSDQQLASEVVSSREAIWGLLSDPKKFAALQS